MLNYIIRRLLHALLIVLIVSFIIFWLVRLLPGDPIEMVLSQNTLINITPELLEEVRAEKGLDRPFLIQYADWLSHVVRGDFGISLLHYFDIGTELGSRIAVTLVLGLTGFIIGVIIGSLLGMISAIRRGAVLDSVIAAVANIGITAPAFWVGILLIYFLGLKLGWLPIYGYTLPWVDFGKSIRQSILPVFVIALNPIASSARQMRSSALEVLSEDYVRTAWAKGLKEKAVIFRHVLKNSLMPVVTLQGTVLRTIIGGSVIVETVFAIPGIGKLLVDSILSQDYPVVQAIVLFMTVAVVIINLAVDLIYGVLDPRIQYG